MIAPLLPSFLGAMISRYIVCRTTGTTSSLVPRSSGPFRSLLWPKESNMKRVMFATLAFVVLTTLVSLAQESANQDNAKQAATQEKQENKPTSHIKTVTGCLQKGDEAG